MIGGTAEAHAASGPTRRVVREDRDLRMPRLWRRVSLDRVGFEPEEGEESRVPIVLEVEREQVLLAALGRSGDQVASQALDLRCVETVEKIGGRRGRLQ
jgi:hypothetical protein